jgi:hypothetical protein
MADKPENKNQQSGLSEEDAAKLRSSLQKVIEGVDPKLLTILGGVVAPSDGGAVDVTVCSSKCL